MSATPAGPTRLPPIGPAAPPVPRGPSTTDRGTVRREEVRAERWSVRGIAKVARDVDVGAGDLGGTVIVGGSFAAGELTVHGSLETRGALQVDGRLRAHGSVDSGAGVQAREASFQGTVRATTELAVATTLEVRGTVRAPTVRAGTFLLRGSAAIPGSVVTTTFDARLFDDSTFGLLQASELRLHGPAPNVVRRVLGREATVTVERVEAKTVHLEAVRARFVRAEEIVLGRAAHVATLEGRLVRAHPSSRVGPESWSRPPAGLSR